MSKVVARHVRRKPDELMKKLLDEERRGVYGPVPAAAESREQPYDTVSAEKALRARLRAKHGVGSPR